MSNCLTEIIFILILILMDKGLIGTCYIQHMLIMFTVYNYMFS